MEEDIKNDLAGIAFSHPFFSDIVTGVLNYIEKLEKENKELQAFGDFFMKNDFIPISVIQNKKSEIEKQLQEYEESDMEQDDDYFFDVNAMQGEIQLLQELLEERNK